MKRKMLGGSWLSYAEQAEMQREKSRRSASWHFMLSTNQDDLGDIASHLNNRLRDLKSQGFEEAWSGEVRELILRVIGALEGHMSDLTATNCSRLAWLYLNVGNEERAYDVTRAGVDREPSNEHCQKLVERLENNRYN